jgi:hypothetical protein
MRTRFSNWNKFGFSMSSFVAHVIGQRSFSCDPISNSWFSLFFIKIKNNNNNGKKVYNLGPRISSISFTIDRAMAGLMLNVFLPVSPP